MSCQRARSPLLPSVSQLLLVLFLSLALPPSSAAAPECPALEIDPCECEGACEDLPILGASVCYVKNPDTCVKARRARTREAGAYITCPPPVDCKGAWRNFGPCKVQNGTAGVVGEQCRTYGIERTSANGGEECPHAHCEEECVSCNMDPVYEEREVCEAYSVESPGKLSIFVSKDGYVSDGSEDECRSFLLREGRKRARKALQIESEETNEVEVEDSPEAKALSSGKQEQAHASKLEFVGNCEILEEDYECSGCKERENAADAGSSCLVTGTRAGHVECTFKLKSMEHFCAKKQVCVKHCSD